MNERLATDLDAAFSDFVSTYQDGLFSGSYRMTGDRGDAEDVTQETFVRAYRALRGYDADRIASLELRPWLWTIALNLYRNRARARARRPETELDGYEAHTGGPEDGAVDRQHLAGLLADLPTPQRAAVVLRHVVDLSYDEMAEALGRPAGTLKADVHRGLERLRSALSKEEVNR